MFELHTIASTQGKKKENKKQSTDDRQTTPAIHLRFDVLGRQKVYSILHLVLCIGWMGFAWGCNTELLTALKINVLLPPH